MPMQHARTVHEGCHCRRAVGLLGQCIRPVPDTVSGDVGRQIASGSGNLHFCQSLGLVIELLLVYESG